MTALPTLVALALVALHEPSSPAAPAEATPDSAHATKNDRARLLQGEWPAQEGRVTLDFDGVKTRDALKRLAAQAQWSLSFKDRPHGRVDASFNDVPAQEALLTILGDHGMVAERHQNLVVITRASSEEDDDDTEPGPFAQSSDRTSIGSVTLVDEGETVRDAVSVGGDVVVRGTVLRNAVSVGGNLVLGPHAEVRHDAVSIGGHVAADPGARIGGERVSIGLLDLALRHGEPQSMRTEASMHSWPHRFAMGIFRFAVLFVLCLMTLAFAPDRVRTIGREICRAPGPSLVIGLLGFAALAPLVLMLAITVVGLVVVPFLALVVAVGLLMGFTALNLEIGARLPPRRARRTPVATLTLGAVVLCLVHLVPYLGAVTLALLLCAAFGAVLRTRFGCNLRLGGATYIPTGFGKDES